MLKRMQIHSFKKDFDFISQIENFGNLRELMLQFNDNSVKRPLDLELMHMDKIRD